MRTSNNLINYIGASVKLHPDFGAGTFGGQSIGIPYQIVGVTQSKVSVKLSASPDESDPGPMPIPSNALIEGFPAPGDGDRHVLVIDKDGCWLYELFNSNLLNSGNWSADSAAIWDLTIDEQRPYTWTSADAAGLPIFLGLARYDEVSSGAINHALRFTVPVTRQAFTPPASHWASSVTDPNAPPMGMRLRLKADFDSSSFSAANQAILTALKTYGMILADNGSAIYISGAPDNRWSNSDLGNLKTLTASDFEVVAMDQIYTEFSNVPTGPPPTITSFAASSNSGHARKTGDLELESIEWRYLQHYIAVGRPGARQQRGRASQIEHDLHAVLDQSVRAIDRHRRGQGSTTLKRKSGTQATTVFGIAINQAGLGAGIRDGGLNGLAMRGQVANRIRFGGISREHEGLTSTAAEIDLFASAAAARLEHPAIAAKSVQTGQSQSQMFGK